jgi:hypothetical protein
MQQQAFDEKPKCLRNEDRYENWDRSNDEWKKRGAVDEKAGAPGVDWKASHSENVEGNDKPMTLPGRSGPHVADVDDEEDGVNYAALDP